MEPTYTVTLRISELIERDATPLAVGSKNLNIEVWGVVYVLETCIPLRPREASRPVGACNAG